MEIKLTYRRTCRLSMRIAKNGDVHVSAPYGMSRKKIEAFVNEHLEWIEGARQRNADRQKRRADFYSQLPLNTRALKEDAIKRLKVLVEPMIKHYSDIMGVRAASVSYKPMISRWGVCKFKEHSICLSIYLLLLPEWCIEHVVVHELCHMLEPSHNARFHALMDKYYPRWRDARKQTRHIHIDTLSCQCPRPSKHGDKKD